MRGSYRRKGRTEYRKKRREEEEERTGGKGETERGVNRKERERIFSPENLP